MATIVPASVVLAAAFEAENRSEKSGWDPFAAGRKSRRCHVLPWRVVTAVLTGEKHTGVPIIIRGLVLKAVISWHEARSPAGLAV